MRDTMAKQRAALPKKDKKQRRQAKTYGQKEVDFSAVFPMPDGYEKLFIVIYGITIPYITGVIFLFLFVAKGRVDNFLTLDLAMFLAVWAIGYEVVASFSLIIIFYKMFTYNRRMRHESGKSIVRDSTDRSLHKVHNLS